MLMRMEWVQSTNEKHHSLALQHNESVINANWNFIVLSLVQGTKLYLLVQSCELQCYNK